MTFYKYAFRLNEIKTKNEKIYEMIGGRKEISCCLPLKKMKYLRLKKQADFQKLFQKGKRAFSPSLTVVYRPAAEMRMGISVGKRHGKSVRRNRIKRLLRESFRKTQGEMQGKYSLVLIPKVCDEYTYETFERHLKWIIKKENL